MVGITFDYLARAMIAQQLNENKDSAYLGLASIAGLNRVKEQVDKKLYDVLAKKYVDVLASFIDHIYSNYACITSFDELQFTEQEEIRAFSKFNNKASFDSYEPNSNIEHLYSGAYYFAKLEQVYRSGGMLRKI